MRSEEQYGICTEFRRVDFGHQRVIPPTMLFPGPSLTRSQRALRAEIPGEVLSTDGKSGLGRIEQHQALHVRYHFGGLTQLYVTPRIAGN